VKHPRATQLRLGGVNQLGHLSARVFVVPRYNHVAPQEMRHL
jgi:hypothetical protein